MELAVTEYPKNLPIDSLLSMEGNLPFAWLTRELTESGVLGDVTAAAKEKGSRILESLSDQEFLDGTRHVIYPWNQSKISNLKSSGPRIYPWGQSKIQNLKSKIE